HPWCCDRPGPPWPGAQADASCARVKGAAFALCRHHKLPPRSPQMPAMPSLSTGKHLAFLLALCIQATGWAAGGKSLQKIDSPDTRSAVQIQVQEGIDVGGGKPGFKLA